MELSKGYVTDIITRLAYNTDMNVEYVGKAASGSASSDETWQITKITYDADQNVTQVAYASGNKKFDKVWDDRTGYSYS